MMGIGFQPKPEPIPQDQKSKLPPLKPKKCTSFWDATAAGQILPALASQTLTPMVMFIPTNSGRVTLWEM
jgi:hypothetical protein